ncbi:rhodanese-like domain-containing protein [Nocardia sp. CDC159]|uniref:Rhodanese-like domain-containing protein n=1 Tax=Nocardia pulmonis TaxID=2951408 RepID=A0A9X2E6L9_9NOCA|nr:MULTISPECIES: rhodanese-like domain-containing protein [Nocardia]MCM6774605.1 rhodanese-like domain-containing protein [Nocardia pulmonis]MCM6787330.1 rhodanese-like domain-containing protein [Nocardia sp. CDC159]
MRTDPIRPEELPCALARGGRLVDIRSQAERTRDGALMGALAIERQLLAARLHPHSRARLSWARHPEVEWVILCSSGDDSAVAALTLRDLGLPAVTSVSGGYHALRAARMLDVAGRAAHVECSVAAVFGGILPERVEQSLSYSPV